MLLPRHIPLRVLADRVMSCRALRQSHLRVPAEFVELIVSQTATWAAGARSWDTRIAGGVSVMS